MKIQLFHLILTCVMRCNGKCYVESDTVAGSQQGVPFSNRNELAVLEGDYRLHSFWLCTTTDWESLDGT